MNPIKAPYAITLRSYWRSSASWRVRIALELKGLKYQYEPVHLVRNGGEQYLPAHLTLNPMAQVPHVTIEDADARSFGLSQSVAIFELLDQIVPTPALFPSALWERARVFELVEMINSGIQPLQNLSVLQAIERLGGDKAQWASEVIAKGLVALEQRCQQVKKVNHTPFVMGTDPGAFEATLIPQLYNARRFSLDLSRYPRLLEIEEQCVHIDAFKKAAPETQPDAQ